MAQTIDPDKRVRVFRNWRLGCYSIMQSGELKASAAQVRLADVEFLVRESGRDRMLRLNRRNVHAYAVGRLVDWVHPDDERRLDPIEGRRVIYDPYEAPSFLDADSRVRVGFARTVDLREDCVIYDDG